MTTNTDTAWATPYFKQWLARLGSKPTAAQLATAAAFAKRAPGHEAMALAMALRDEGVTGSQVLIACGAPQNNHRTKLITAGFFKREATGKVDGHTVYKITLTKRGEAAVTKREAVTAADAAMGDKPVTVKAKAKAKPANKRKAKATATVDVPATAPALATDTVGTGDGHTPTADTDVLATALALATEGDTGDGHTPTPAAARTAIAAARN